MGIQLQILDLFAWALLSGSAFGCFYLWYACHAVERFSKRGSDSDASGKMPPVSVMKPLRGEDVALAENLRSFCRQDYPRYQIVFGVADAQDPAVAVVRALMAEFPAADLALVIDPGQQGANLKVANLRNMLPSVRHDILVLADSDMRVAPSYLAQIVPPLMRAAGDGQAAGLVTCLYRGVSTGGLWSDLACLHINHGFLPQAVLAERLGLGAGCFGATMAVNRTTLEAVGGFEALADTLADDHVLGQRVRRLGLAVALSPYLVDNIVAEFGLRRGIPTRVALGADDPPRGAGRVRRFGRHPSGALGPARRRIGCLASGGARDAGHGAPLSRPHRPPPRPRPGGEIRPAMAIAAARFIVLYDIYR